MVKTYTGIVNSACFEFSSFTGEIKLLNEISGNPYLQKILMIAYDGEFFHLVTDFT